MDIGNELKELSKNFSNYENNSFEISKFMINVINKKTICSSCKKVIDDEEIIEEI